MLQLKMIESIGINNQNQKWIVLSDGIKFNGYDGALSWFVVGFDSHNHMKFNPSFVKPLLCGLFKKSLPTIARFKSDTIRNLTLQEYLIFGKLLKSCNFKYNKKKNELCLKS